jgi:hypothetical protein
MTEAMGYAVAAVVAMLAALSVWWFGTAISPL